MAEKEEKRYSDLSDEEKIREFEETLDKISVKEIVLGMMATLSTLAYRKLGMPDEKKQDLEQASMAIDAFDALFKSVEKSLASEESSSLQSTLSALQMTYSSLKLEKTEEE